MKIVVFFILIICMVGIFFTKKRRKYFYKIISSQKRIFSILIEYSRWYLVISIIFSIAKGLFPIISLLLVQRIINIIQLKNTSFRVLITLIISYVMIEISYLLATELYKFYTVKFSKKFSKNIEVKILEKANKLSVKDFENTEIYDLISRAQSQNGDTIISYINTWNLISTHFITIVASCVLLINYRYWMFFLLVIIPVIKFYYSKKLAKEQYCIELARTSEERKCWYINYLMLLGNAIKEIIIYRLGDIFIEQYKSLRDKFIAQDFKIVNKTFFITSISILIGQIFIGIIYLHIFIDGYRESIYLGDVTAYITCITIIQAGVELILSMVNTIYSKSLYLKLLLDYFDIPEKKIEEENRKVKIDCVKLIELKNLSYRYSKKSEYALKNINLTIDKTNVIALVGRNGSGKTTLVKIILGLYEDYEGDFYVNNINFRDIDKNSYYKKISCVFQDFIKYETTIRENVAYGNIDEINNSELIKSVLIKTGLDIEYIRQDKLDTILGNWFGKTQLSEGQWQKIAVSRAMFKESDFYILDEPDATLDEISRTNMLINYKELLENRAGIIISHNMSYLNKLCKKIVVLDKGMIVEVGTHIELIRNEQIYYDLFSN
ncbi:MAG: ABC transporter ATP-binding protein [Eubacteriales bacterium]